ncbi:hypothetical protein GQR58_029237 [Nymphon striatum]|nr:hypothetical protein GQR58_029237 [Nymphon striatum]
MIEASDAVSARLIEIAAATAMVPSEVLAPGVSEDPVVSAPVLASACSSASVRSAATCLSTPVLPVPSAPAGAPCSPSAGAPMAAAVAVDVEADSPRASMVTSPVVVVTLRSRVAVTWWFTMVSASEMPTAALPLAEAEPVAVVVAVMAAGGARPAIVSEPVSDKSGSPVAPTLAVRLIVETAMAMAGTTATPVEPAPAVEVVRDGDLHTVGRCTRGSARCEGVGAGRCGLDGFDYEGVAGDRAVDLSGAIHRCEVDSYRGAYCRCRCNLCCCGGVTAHAESTVAVSVGVVVDQAESQSHTHSGGSRAIDIAGGGGAHGAGLAGGCSD